MEKEKVEETVEVDVEQAKKVLEEAESKRQNECLKEVLAILDKYGYTFKIDNSISLIKKNNG